MRIKLCNDLMRFPVEGKEKGQGESGWIWRDVDGFGEDVETVGARKKKNNLMRFLL